MEKVERVANKCENCKSVFYKLPCQLKVTKKPYCSRSCYWEHRKGKPIKHLVEDENLSNKISKALTGKPQPWMQNEKHHLWKGSKASYGAKHQWIRRRYGKADRCDNPECVYPRTNASKVVILKPKRFEWSLIHGNEHGHSRKRYWRLCPSCHRRYDKKIMNLEWKTEKRKITQLVGHDRNPRKISNAQMIQLKASIEKFNFVEIPAIDKDNTILAGHQRLKAMQLIGRGEEEIDVRVPNRLLTKDERDEYLIRSNKNQGEFDNELLAEFEKNMLADVGFESNELDRIFKDENQEDDFDADKEAESIVTPVAKLGDVYQLGRHRLMCGDSSKKRRRTKINGGGHSRIWSSRIRRTTLTILVEAKIPQIQLRMTIWTSSRSEKCSTNGSRATKKA